MGVSFLHCEAYGLAAQTRQWDHFMLLRRFSTINDPKIARMLFGLHRSWQQHYSYYEAIIVVIAS